MVRGIIVVLLVTLSGGVCPGQAQPGPRLYSREATPGNVIAEVDLYFNRLTVNDGLPQNYVTALAQDSLGFVWIGTAGGLTRYDGLEVTIFQTNPDDPSSLQDLTVTALHAGPDGVLWVGTQEAGLARYDPVTGRFHTYPSASLENTHLDHPAVTDVVGAPDGAVWVSTVGSIHRLDPATDRFERWLVAGGTFIHGLAVAHGQVWAGTNRGLYRIDLETRVLAPATDDLTGRVVNQLLAADDGTLWLGTQDGLRRYDPVAERVEAYPAIPEAQRSIQFLLDVPGPTAWLATPEGLHELDPNTQTFVAERLWRFPGSSNLPATPGTVAMVDNQGILWLGTAGSGLAYADLITQRFAVYTGHPALEGQSIRSVRADTSGLWIAPTEGGLWHLPLGTGTLTRRAQPLRHRAFDDTDLPFLERTAMVWGVDRDREGDLWLSYLFGFEERTAEGTLKRRLSLRGQGPFSPQPMFVHEDGNGTLWTGHPTFGVLDPETGVVTPALSQFDGRVRAHRLHVDPQGLFWLATHEHGLVKYDPSQGTAVAYRPAPGDTTSIPTDHIQSLWADSSGVLWLGTSAGLARFDPATERAHRFTTFNSGLPDQYINGVLGDERGRLWISTNRGLARYDTDTDQFTRYDVRRGLQAQEFNRGAYDRGPDGMLYFGGIAGLNAFAPQGLRDNPIPPTLLLTGLTASDGTRDVDHLPQPQAGNVSVALTHRQNDLTFQYAGLHYAAPDLNRYQYRLEGPDFEDTGWGRVTALREARYTNLRPGTYTFHVRATSALGVWSASRQLATVTVARPFWATWWFRGLAGLALVGLVAGTMWGRLAAQRQRERLLKIEVAERTQALQRERDVTKDQAARLRAGATQQRNLLRTVSHEARTPLTLILAPVERLLESSSSDEATREALHLIRRNARRLLFITERLVDLARLEGGLASLNARPVPVNALVEAIAEAFKPVALQQQLTLHVSVTFGPLVAEADPDLLELVLFNLVANAIRHTPPGGTVHVEAESDDEHVLITVRDTGVGIPTDKLMGLLKRPETMNPSQSWGMGLGLALVWQALRLHNGEALVESAVGQGTTFSVRWPRRAPFGTAAQVGGPDQQAPERVALAHDPLDLYGLPQAPQPRPASVEEAPPEGETDRTTILIVDDNEGIRAYLAEALAARYEVEEAADGHEGLAKARELVPDLILSDIMMPGLSGLDLCQAIKADPALRFVPIILMTGRDGAEARVEGLAQGADDYMAKPFVMRELEARIQNLIDSRRTWRAALEEARPFPDVYADVPPADEAFRDRLHALLVDHFTDGQFTAGTLAEHAGLSPAHLRRKTQELFGVSPTELIRLHRLRQAALLLERQAGTVAEIAYAVGFNSVSYFTRSFRAHFGQPPSQYAEFAQRSPEDPEPPS
ncbi:MAG: two-component regulator propeller domain-containing protein [Bacteroidota bacterium]